MKIKKMNRGIFCIIDDRIGFSFFACTKRWMETVLLKRGYHKGASDDCYLMPGEIIPGENEDRPYPT